MAAHSRGRGQRAQPHGTAPGTAPGLSRDDTRDDTWMVGPAPVRAVECAGCRGAGSGVTSSKSSSNIALSRMLERGTMTPGPASGPRADSMLPRMDPRTLSGTSSEPAARPRLSSGSSGAPERRGLARLGPQREVGVERRLQVVSELLPPES